MKKVLFVINTLGGAGAEKALLELLKRFPENEYEVLPINEQVRDFA
jgi:hypothetical protein